MRLAEGRKIIPAEQLGSHWTATQGPYIGRQNSSPNIDPVRVAVWGGILLAAPLTWAGIILAVFTLL